MSRFLKKEKRKQERGITLIALITTIIVLLILAGITIGAITGSNGIIGQAQSAKEETEISQEKEIIDISTVEAMGKNNRGNLEEEEFQNALNSHTNGNVEVSTSGEEFEVFFEESNRYYIVDKDGNIGEMNEYIEDNSPGDITKDENGKELAGTEDEPYEIWCIEDLVKLAQMVNEEGKNLNNQYIVLKRDLNFTSKLSYMNPNTTEFDTFLGGDGTTPLIKQLSEEENGFEPIGKDVYTLGFAGSFDGKNHIIKNIYINKNGSVGLFGGITYNNSGSKISNLNTHGKIVVETGQGVGGVVGRAGNTVIENCHSDVEIIGKPYGMGGIVGICQYRNVDIINCSNQGNLESTYTSIGGVVGVSQGDMQLNIINSYNTGEIKSNNRNIGGIVGESVGIVNIYNSFNIGNISGGNVVGGIVGISKSNITLRNVYMAGKVNATSTYAGIIGTASDSSKINSNNIYYLKVDNLVGIREEEDEEFNIIGYTENEWDSNKIINSLNEGRNLAESEIDKTNWKTWTLGENKYPVFVEN